MEPPPLGGQDLAPQGSPTAVPSWLGSGTAALALQTASAAVCRGPARCPGSARAREHAPR